MRGSFGEVLRSPSEPSGPPDGKPEEKSPETALPQAENSEQLANDILNHLAERLGTADRYHSEITEAEIAHELYSKFGIYDTDFVYAHWEKMKESPSTIQNPTLKEIFETAQADNGFDRSLLNDTLAFADTALVPIRQQLAALETTQDLEEKKVMLDAVKKEIDKTIQLREYTIYRFGGTAPLSLKDLEYDSSPSTSSRRGSTIHLGDIATALQRANFHIHFEETLGTLDKSKLEADTLLYGAKGANLEELGRIREAVKGFGLASFGYEIPEYRLIPVSIYEKQMRGERILDDVSDVYNWINKRKVIIRSSAVFSEDSEEATGAGIYESVILESDATLRQFLAKIKEVYKSVNSPGAVQYRREHGIPDEKMGLVIQEFMDSAVENKGYINTVLKNVPELMEIAYENGVRPLIIKERALDAIVHHDGRAPIAHYEIDSRRKSPHEIRDLALFVTLIEKHYGQPIQIEFLAADKDGIIETFLLQTRFLPKSFSEKRHIEFPQEKSLFEGRAVGAFDLTLPVLSNKGYNNEKNGVVIFQSSKFYTLGEYGAEEAMPSSGAVIILGGAVEGGGHIETICAEKGIALIFSDEIVTPDMGAHQVILEAQLGIKSGVRLEKDNLQGFTTLRLVSNGLEGRVYGVGERLPGYEEEKRLRDEEN